jgi:hypothetical protein
MEDIVYAAALGVLVVFALYGGKHLAHSHGHAVLLALVVTVAVTVALYCVTIGFAVVSPDSLDPRQMRPMLVELLLFGSMIGIVAALSGRRRAVKAAARLF